MRLTVRPVQNMGHCSQGAWREGTHVLRYGFRTTSGRIGGVRVEALARAAAAAWPRRLKRMMEKEMHRKGCGSLVKRQRKQSKTT